MSYQLIKALHVTSVMAFIGGLLMMSIAIGIPNLTVQRAVRRWDRRVTLPALALLWASGATIAMHGGWFGDVWLTCKLLFVAGLSALHGMLSGTMRRIERDAPQAVAVPLPFRHAGAITLVATAAIVLLVMVKRL